MSTPTWDELLAAASTPDEVVSIANDFQATVDANEVATLPDVCQPRRLLDAESLVSFAYDLMQQDCPACSSQSALERLRAFFAQAAARIAELSAPTSILYRWKVLTQSDLG